MPATNGDTVQVEYKGRLEDGTEFDTSDKSGPAEFRLGEGEVIPGFEEAVIGLEVGEQRNVKVPPEKGYGPRIEELVMRVPKDSFQSDVEVGCVVGLADENGQPVGEAVVTDVGDEVTLDLNHPLAGQTLDFEVKLADISESSR